MATTFLRTSDLAQELDVHVNTIRIYEASGFLSNVPRGTNGYRQYRAIHLEQARLAHLALHWPYVGNKQHLIDLVKSAANDDLGMAMEFAYEYLADVRAERTHAEAAIAFLERWAAGYALDASSHPMHIRQAAAHLNVSIDMLRNWERNGLLTVPREPANQYRLYGSAELGRLRVIRMLVKSGFSLAAILRMLQQADSGNSRNLRDALNIPSEEDTHDYVVVAADRWLASLLKLEQRAQEMIELIGRMIEMLHTQ
ncbi:MerR family transcriptional regulator [Ktedonospora formicarum]|uniref:MerR family transcriptional regulator n=1 Tax=Ktedonospora formicarum TaxID=2778364 RepID=A0A8J3MZ93_9CHLR|nr:MerR family transcriptional regulator [Ktedonospora formicarum]GHO50555.1 MerR family transcriptional regulator [Ktedonospora formicarum]